MIDLTPKVKAQPFITVIPTRSPVDKLHATRGLALAALKYTARVGALYEMRDGEWVLLCTSSVEYVDPPYSRWRRASQILTWEEGEQP